MNTDFSQIIFDPTKHSYTLNGQTLTSVTKTVKQFQKPFDRDRIAARVAQKQGRPVEDIIAEWEAKGEASRRLGTQVHERIEKILTGRSTAAGDPFMSLNELPEMDAFAKLWHRLRKRVNVHQTEWVVGDTAMGIAGTVDSVFYGQDTEQYHVWDWKTGKFDTANRFENLLPPFSHLDASKLHIYSLQTSLYRLIIERNTDLEMGDSYLVHLGPDGNYMVHQAVDLRSQLSILFRE